MASVAAVTSADDVTVDGAGAGGGGTMTIAAAFSCKTLTISSATNTMTVACDGTHGITASGAVTLTKGTLNTNGQTCSWGSFYNRGSATRTLTMGASQITITSASFAVWLSDTGTGCTVTANTATIIGNAAAQEFRFANVANWNGISVTFTGSGVSILNVAVAGTTFTNVTRTGTADKTNSFLTTGPITCTGTCTLGGNTTQGVNRLFVASQTVGTQCTITAAAYVINGDVDFQDINLAYSGGASWTNTGSAYIGDCGGNAGAVTTNATVSATQTATGTSSFTWSTHGWTSRVPLPQDDVVINNAFIAAQTVTADMPRLGRSIDFTGATGTPNFSPSLAWTMYGSLNLTGVTRSANQNPTLAGRGSYTITMAGNTWGNAFTISAPGGTYTAQDLLIVTNTFFVSDGTFVAASAGVTCGTFAGQSGRTSAVTCGIGTWTLTATGNATVWNVVSPVVVSAASATIVIAATDSGITKTFAGGGKTYGTLRHIAAGSAALTITGNNSFSALDLECTTARTITLPASGVQVVSGTTTLQGASGQLLSLVSSTPGTRTFIISQNQTTSNISLSADVQLLNYNQLATSGNEITDATRTTNTQGDGLTIPAGYGIWEATTNLFTNGGFETDTTGWQAYQSTSATRVTTDYKFGSASVSVVTPGTHTQEGIKNTPRQNLSANTAYTYSFWVKAPSGTTMKSYIDEYDGSSVFQKSDIVSFTATGTWQRVTNSFTTSATTASAQIFAFVYNSGGGNAAATTFFVDGVQLEQKAIATPYVETNGGTASRTNSSVLAPSSNLNAATGWFVSRVRMGFPSSQDTGQNTYIFSWGTLGTDWLSMEKNTGAGATWTVVAQHGGTTVTRGVSAGSWAAGDYLTLGMYWTPNSVAISINGANWTSSATTGAPSIGDSTFSIGRYSAYAYGWLDGDILWMATGTGTLADADAATLNSLGNTDPTWTQLAALNSGGATPTANWTAVTTQFDTGPAGTSPSSSLSASLSPSSSASRSLSPSSSASPSSSVSASLSPSASISPSSSASPSLSPSSSVSASRSPSASVSRSLSPSSSVSPSFSPSSSSSPSSSISPSLSPSASASSSYSPSSSVSPSSSGSPSISASLSPSSSSSPSYSPSSSASGSLSPSSSESASYSPSSSASHSLSPSASGSASLSPSSSASPSSSISASLSPSASASRSLSPSASASASISPSSSVSASPSQQVFGIVSEITAIQQTNTIIISQLAAVAITATQQADTITIVQPAPTSLVIID